MQKEKKKKDKKVLTLLFSPNIMVLVQRTKDLILSMKSKTLYIKSMYRHEGRPNPNYEFIEANLLYITKFLSHNMDNKPIY